MLLPIFLVVFCFSGTYGQDVKCSKEFCNDYTTRNSCPELPANCFIQNSTHNGIILPFPDPCNCCDYCLENRGEGADCAMGSPMTQAPNNICGPGLSCQDSKCRAMTDKDCPKAQQQYDEDRKNNNLGHMQLRPNCDRDGFFESWKCVPGEICYCVNENGERIFGEIPFTDLAHVLLKCGCSRKLDRMKSFLGREIQRHEFLRCTSDGNYDPIQCIDEKCFCVDVKTGSPEYPAAEPVKINEISAKNLKCFDQKLHTTFDYYKKCEDKFMKKIEKLVEAKKEYPEIVAHVYSTCSPDGTYMPVQKDGTHKYCVDQDGKKMANYIVDISSAEAQQMNCNCARASLLVEGPEKPACSSNGNYDPIQCRRGWCRCVDTNGNQIGKEILETKKGELSCR